MSVHSYTSYDYMPVKIVPVIASFDSKGQIRPLYVRIDEASYKICSCFLRNRFANLLEFSCRILDGQYHKPLLLTYYRAEGAWGIPIS